MRVNEWMLIMGIKNMFRRFRCEHDWECGDKIKEYQYGQYNLAIGVFRCTCKKCGKHGKQKFIMGKWR